MLIGNPKPPGRALAGAPRATFRVEPSTGEKWWAFAGADGRVVSVRETPGLRQGLAAVRMGELVVDDKTGRELLDRISTMENRAALAQQVVKTYPLEAQRHGLPAAVTEWREEMDRNRSVIDRLKAAAQRAIIIRTWGSASDEDLAVLGRLEEGAISLEERAHTVEAAAKPAGGGVRPPIPSPVTEPSSNGISTLGWIGIGAGALAALGILAAFLSRGSGDIIMAGSGSLPRTEKVLYGVREGDEDWQETILSTQPERFDEVKAMAARDGWGRFRIATVDLTKPPDFSRTVKRQRRSGGGSMAGVKARMLTDQTPKDLFLSDDDDRKVFHEGQVVDIIEETNPGSVPAYLVRVNPGAWGRSHVWVFGDKLRLL